jgi:hypothetical protein
MRLKKRISINRRNEQCGEESPLLFDLRKHGNANRIIRTRLRRWPLENTVAYGVGACGEVLLTLPGGRCAVAKQGGVRRRGAAARGLKK